MATVLVVVPGTVFLPLRGLVVCALPHVPQKFFFIVIYLLSPPSERRIPQQSLLQSALTTELKLRLGSTPDHTLDHISYYTARVPTQLELGYTPPIGDTVSHLAHSAHEAPLEV